MFKRRKPRALLSELRGWLWPHIGWRRAAHYFWMRLKRLTGTPHSIAAGFASGAAASATPFVGLHFLTAFAIAFATRGNYLAAAIGTSVGNPWTFPFIWAWTYKLGNLILGREPRNGGLFHQLSWEQFIQTIDTVFWPMVVGGLPTALAFWLIWYFPLRRLVGIYQQARRRRQLHRKQQIARQLGNVRVPPT